MFNEVPEGASLGGYAKAVHALTELGVSVAHGTFLPLAAVGGHTEIVRWFLWLGVDVHQRSERSHQDLGGRNALELASRYQHAETLGVLLPAGANIQPEGCGFVQHNDALMHATHTHMGT